MSGDLTALAQHPNLVARLYNQAKRNGEVSESSVSGGQFFEEILPSYNRQNSSHPLNLTRQQAVGLINQLGMLHDDGGIFDGIRSAGNNQRASMNDICKFAKDNLQVLSAVPRCNTWSEK